MEIAAVKSIIRRFVEAIILAAALLSPLIGRMARAGVLPMKATTCVEVANDGGCLIGASHVGLSLKMQGTEIAAEMIDSDSEEESVTESLNEAQDEVETLQPIHSDPTVSLTSDLHQRVREGRLSADEALLIETELLARRDAFYYLPNSIEQLKMDVGFAPDAVLPVQDPVELLKVHVQLALSVSPQTASYLTERLGVRTRQSQSQAGPNQVAMPSVDANVLTKQWPPAPHDGTDPVQQAEPEELQEPTDPATPLPETPLLRETASVAQSQS